MNSITLFSIGITLVVYLFSRIIARRYPSPLTSPVGVSTAVLIGILLFSGISYEEYTPAKDIMTYLLGPATVALAVPLYHNRMVLTAKIIPAAAGLITGTLATIISAVSLVKLTGLSETIAATAATKAVTTPVAIEAAMIIGGDPSLAAAFVMAAGMFGAIFGPIILKLINISDPFSRGLSYGTVAHGIGTTQAVAEGPLSGAVSGAAMGFAAIFTSIVLPWLFPLIY